MAISQYNCDITQAFNFEKDKQTLVGHLLSLKVGTTEYDVDLSLTDPLDNTKSVKVVGAINGIFWAGGYANSVSINCNISTANKTKTSVLLHTNMVDTSVEFKFKVYEFDLVAKKYFLAFHTEDTVMKGYVRKEGGDLVLSVDTDPDPTVPSPANYFMGIEIMPKEEAQQLKVAVSDTDKFSKQWGVTNAK